MTKTKSRNKADLKASIKKAILNTSLFDKNVTPPVEKDSFGKEVFFTFGIELDEINAIGIPFEEILQATRESLMELFPETHKKIKFSIMWENTISISVPNSATLSS